MPTLLRPIICSLALVLLFVVGIAATPSSRAAAPPPRLAPTGEVTASADQLAAAAAVLGRPAGRTNVLGCQAGWTCCRKDAIGNCLKCVGPGGHC